MSVYTHILIIFNYSYCTFTINNMVLYLINEKIWKIIELCILTFHTHTYLFHILIHIVFT